MNTQRQKKRNSQFKKKHHDSRVREKDGARQGKEVAKQPSGISGGKGVKVESPDPAPAHTRTQPLETEVYKEKQYTKRKVTSNWDRYTEGKD